MNPYDIYSVDRVWKNCPDQRPYVIVDVRGGDVYGCFPISAHCYGGNCFFVNEAHPDFAATGLTKSCHIRFVSIIEVRQTEFRRHRGKPENQLLKDFTTAAGL